MFSFLSPDSKFSQVLNRFADLVLLNILFLLTCLPLFTVGAAHAAMYTLCFRMVRNREGSIVKAYFRAFRDNFKQGTVLWLLMLLVCLPSLYYIDVFFAMEGAKQYLFVAFFAVFMLAMYVSTYAFPWISQFQNDTPTVLRNALILSVSNFPRTLCICVIRLLPLGILLVSPMIFFQISFLWVALYFSAATYLSSSILWKVFKPYYPDET